MLKIDGYSIELTRGDTLRLTISLQDSEGNPVSLTDLDHLWFRLKKKAKDETILIEKSGDPVQSLIALDEPDTENIPFGKYKYEIEVVTSDDEHYTVIANQDFTIGEELENH
jgi:hypothetical protein